jgi:hypothetical protein
MNPIDRFQKIRDYIDSQNICDMISEYLSEDDLQNFCDYLEEEFDIEYDDDYSNYGEY